jgi:hypothetical protein
MKIPVCEQIDSKKKNSYDRKVQKQHNRKARRCARLSPEDAPRKLAFRGYTT